LGDWYYVAAVPVSALVIALVNYLMAHHVYTQQKQSTYLLMMAAVAVGALLLWASYLIVAVNIF